MPAHAFGRSLIALLGTLLVVSMAWAAEQEVVTSDSVSATLRTGRLEVLLRSAEPLSVTFEALPDGYLVTFPHQFDGTPFADVLHTAPNWLTDVRYGFDAVFLVPQTGISVSSQTTDNGLMLHFSRSAPAPETNGVAVDDDGSDLRLARLQALIAHRLGDSQSGRASLRQLMTENPADTQSILDLIDIEKHLGRWEHALTLYNRALERAPGTAFLISGKAALLRQNGQFVDLNVSRTAVRNADEQLRTVFSNRIFVRRDARIGTRFERRDVDTATVVDPQTGTTAPFHASRARMEAYLELSDAVPGRVRFLFHGARAVVGAGFDYELGWNGGRSRVQTRWHAPEWDFVEGIVHSAWRDRIVLPHEFDTSVAWSGDISVSLNRYGLHKLGALTHSIETQAALRYQLFGNDPALSIGYRLDAKYYGAVASRTDINGLRFTPIGFSNSEVHQFDFAITEQLSDYLQLSASAGYNVDRQQERGPFWRVGLAYAPLPTVELGLAYASTKSTSAGSGGATTEQNGFIRIRF